MAKVNVNDGQGKIAFMDSIKTKLIGVMLAVTIIPLVISIGVSYKTSTNKAITDAENSVDWQAWYIQARFDGVINNNFKTIQSVGMSPAIADFMENQDDEYHRERALKYLSGVDEMLADGNLTVLTGADGMQVLRTKGDLVDVSERDYFKTAMTGKNAVSNVIVSTATGIRQITMACPIFGNDGSVVGIVQRNYDLNEFHNLLVDEAEGNEAFLVAPDGVLAAHSDYEIAATDDPTDLSKSPFMTSTEQNAVYVSNYGGSKSIVAFVKNEQTGYVISCAERMNVVMASARKSALIVILIGVIMLVIAVVISLLMAKSFVDPVKDVNDSLAALADGRFSVIEKHGGRKDEFGHMVVNTNSVLNKLSEIVGRIKESASSVAQSSEELSDTANQISQTAEDVSNAVQEIASGATQQADEIQSASENVGRIGDAVMDVQNSTGNLSGIAQKMKEASEVSSRSLESLQASSSDMTNKIDDISNTISATQEAVSNINDKVEGIASIATQTNLLSLNASIEAARAGEAGKGFAVVAEEIGKLADDSKQMADDIRREMDILLEQSNAAVSAAAEVKQGNMDQQIALGETLEAVNGMLEDIGSTVGGVDLISQGAETCDSSKNAVVDTMSALSAISEENAASSEETGASMQELSATVTTLASSADDLKAIADTLREDMSFFK